MKKYFLTLILILTLYLTSFAQYEMDYTGAQLDTAIAVQRAQIVRQTKYGYQKPYTTIQAAITASDSGDCVFIKTGYYSLGSDSLKLKNGVDLFCYPGVTIHSTNANKTISDGNVQVTVSIKGSPTITNSNGLNKRIVRSNSSSVINDFWWEYQALLYNNSGSYPSPSNSKVLLNTIGGTITWASYSAGKFSAKLTGAFLGQRTHVDFPNVYFHNDSAKFAYIDVYTDSIEFYNLHLQDFSEWYGTQQSNSGSQYYKKFGIKVFP